MWMLIIVKCNDYFDPKSCGNESFPFKGHFSCQVFQTEGSIPKLLFHFLLLWQPSCNLSDSNDTLGTSGWDLILCVCPSTQWPSFQSHIQQINVSEKNLRLPRRWEEITAGPHLLPSRGHKSWLGGTDAGTVTNLHNYWGQSSPEYLWLFPVGRFFFKNPSLMFKCGEDGAKALVTPGPLPLPCLHHHDHGSPRWSNSTQ